MKSYNICLFYLLVFQFLIAKEKDQIIDLGTIFTFINDKKTDSYFSSEDIEKSTASTLTDFLAENNCLSMKTGGIGTSSNISIRGYAGACIKVYVDGILANDPSTGEFDWNSIPLESIVSIEINNEPSISQEQFSGATISITTKSFSAQKISFSFQNLSYESNLFDSQFLNINYQNVIGKTAFKFSFSSIQSDNQYFDINSKKTENQEYKSNSIFFNWSRYIKSHSIGGTHSFSMNKLNVPENFSAFGIQESIFSTHTLFTDLFFPIGSTQIKLTYDLDKQSFFVPSNSTDNSNNIFHSFALQLTQNFSVFNFSCGYFEPLFFVKSNFIQSIFNFSEDSNFQPNRFSLYSSFSPKLKIFNFEIEPILGYLFVCDSINKFSQTKSVFHQFNASVLLDFWNFISISANTQNALPTFNQLFWNYSKIQENSSTTRISEHGNPNLKPESGYSIRLKILPINLSFGFSYYENKIRWINGKYQNNSYISMFPENTSSAYYFDTTFSSGKDFSLTKHIYIGYDLKLTLTKTFLLDEQFYGNQIMWVPFSLINSSIKFGYKKITAYLNYDFTSKRYTSNLNTTYYTPIHLLSFSTVIKCTENISLFLSAKNILDQRYFYHDNYSAPSRNYSVKIKAIF